MGKFSKEDLSAILEQVASNPAILFPNLTEEERGQLIKEALDQLDEMEKADGKEKLTLDLDKSFRMNDIWK